MDYSEARKRLRVHSGYDVANERTLAKEESFDAPLRMVQGLPVPRADSPAVTDVLECLEAVNREWNGSQPSEFVEGKAGDLEREMVGAVSVLLYDGWEVHRKLALEEMASTDEIDALAKALWRIGTAWQAVLDGDVDSIREHVNAEERARWR